MNLPRVKGFLASGMAGKISGGDGIEGGWDLVMKNWAMREGQLRGRNSEQRLRDRNRGTFMDRCVL